MFYFWLSVCVALASAQCYAGFKNLSYPDNGNVCDMLASPYVPETTCMASISSGLNATLAACAGDTYIIIILEAGFDETGPFYFPDVVNISIYGNNITTLRGGSHVVAGNRTALLFDSILFAGDGTTDLLFLALRSNNLTLTNCVVRSFHGKQTILMEGCDDDVKLVVLSCYFLDNWGASLFAAGLDQYNIQSNTFDRCGGYIYGATFLKDNWVTRDSQIFYNNSHWLLFDQQPPTCITYIDGGQHLRCINGQFECENLLATQVAGDCPTENVTYFDPLTNMTVSELLYMPYCRHYGPCTCESVTFHDVSNTTVNDFTLNVGDIIYPYYTLPCTAGSNLVNGGGVGSVAPLVFADPSFENPFVHHPKWNTSGPNVLAQNSDNIKPFARTGTGRILCPGKADTWFEQPVNFTAAGTYVVSFWGARNYNTRYNFGGGFVEVWLDGVQQVGSSIGDPTFRDTLINDQIYYEFVFPTFTVATASVKMFRVRCNFAATGNLEFAIDDIASRASGLVVVSFPPGQGLGLPFGANPLDYIALPLTSDAYIAPLPCPACPPPPPTPPDLVCNYTIEDPVTCYPTIYNGNMICVDPTLYNTFGSAKIHDPSFENATYYWTDVLGVPVRDQSQPGVPAARTGTHLLFADIGDDIEIKQHVIFGASAYFTLGFWGRRLNDISHYDGKAIRLRIDGVIVDQILNPQIGATTPGSSNYFQFFFQQQFVLAGAHNVALEIDMTGGSASAAFAVDDVQFFGATSTPSSSPTPSPSPSHVPVNATNVTVIPATALTCEGSMLYLGGVPWTYGCIVPGQMIVDFNGYAVTANDCMTVFSSSGCTLPDNFIFTLNTTVMECYSLSLGIMACDCSIEKLLGLYLNRTITPNVCAYEWDQVPYGTPFFVSINRAQQLPYGGCSRRIDYDTVAFSSPAVADYFDQRAVGRELIRVNPLLWGQIPDPSMPSGIRNAPRFLQDALDIYAEECDDGCPMTNPTRTGAPGTICIVNNAVADFDPTVYAFMQDAASDGHCSCPTCFIDFQNTENMDEEDVTFTNKYVQIFSSTNASLLGVHIIGGNVEVFFSRGVVYIHSGKNGVPQFDIDNAGSLINLTLYNNMFVGNGVKNAAVVNNKKQKVPFIDVAYNSFYNYQTTCFRATASDAIVQHNTQHFCSGRLFQIRYDSTVISQHNLFIDSRGAQNIQNPALFEFHYTGRTGQSNCMIDDSKCAIRRMTQLIKTEDPETSPDYQEIGVLLRGGTYFIETITDLAIVKAQIGLRARGVTIIAPAAVLQTVGSNGILELLQYNNSLVRPTRFRSKKDGADFAIDGVFQNQRFSKVSCSFPDCTSPQNQPQRCVANLNFESYYSRRFGWETFTNTTQASTYCPLNFVNVTNFGGAGIIPEILNVSRPYTDNILHPLYKLPTTDDILFGRDPVPSRFTVQGVGVTADDAVFYGNLLAANNTYGFGDMISVFVRTDLICGCPAQQVPSGQATTYVSTNCTTLVGPFQNQTAMCEPYFLSGALTCVVGSNSQLECTVTGSTIVGQSILVFLYTCSMPIMVTYNVSGPNGTFIILNETFYDTETNIPGNPNQCSLTLQNVTANQFVDGTLNLCTRPKYYGVGGQFRALNITWRNLEWWLNFGNNNFTDTATLNVAVLEAPEGVLDTEFDTCTFDFRKQVPPTPMSGLKLYPGLTLEKPYGRKKENQLPPVYTILYVHNCTFKNAVFYNSTLGNAPNTTQDESELSQFPNIIAIEVDFINIASNDSTTAIYESNVFEDIDGVAIQTRYANTTIFFNNTGLRTGGRALNTPAAYWFEANAQSPNAMIFFVQNNLTQTRPVTYPFLGDDTVPAYQAMLLFTGLRDAAITDCTTNDALTIDQCLADTSGLCCPVIVMYNNFVCGLPIGARFVGETGPIEQFILSGIPGNPAPIINDKLVALRELALVNNVSIDGTVCDLVIGAENLDWAKEWLCCQEACAPRNPTRCRVNSSDPAINPTHPWFDIFWFDDINLALRTCQADSLITDLENPVPSTPYEVRLTADILQPALIAYNASWSGPVDISVLATFPMPGLSSPPSTSIPIKWTDESLGPLSFVIFPSQPPVPTSSIKVKGSLQMPSGIMDGTTATTPAAWPMTITIEFFFCAPSNSEAPVLSFPFTLAYTSPPININTPSFDYAAVVVVSWTWTAATATLVTNTVTTLNGVGLPTLLCNGHSPSGAGLTVQNVKMSDADPCTESLDPITCPCTTPGLATWDQSDATPLHNLKLRNIMWDGRGHHVLAIDGYFWTRVDLIGSTFVDYRLKNPGYVVRLQSSPTEDCCALPCVTEIRVNSNTFIGEDLVAMTGNVVWIGPTELAIVTKNSFLDVSGQDTVHPTPAMIYIKSCTGMPLNGQLTANQDQRVTGTAIQTRIPPNDCYWTAYEIDDASQASGFTISNNVQIATMAMPVCLRPIDYFAVSSSHDCTSAVRLLQSQNPGCYGSIFNVVRTGCALDVCLARSIGCEGSDAACLAATVPPCSSHDFCYYCSGACGTAFFDPPLWLLITATVIATILFIAFLYCCGCCMCICAAAWPYTIRTEEQPPRRAPNISTLNEQESMRLLVNERA